jgi:hypothetical protein
VLLLCIAVLAVAWRRRLAHCFPSPDDTGYLDSKAVASKGRFGGSAAHSDSTMWYNGLAALSNGAEAAGAPMLRGSRGGPVAQCELSAPPWEGGRSAGRVRFGVSACFGAGDGDGASAQRDAALLNPESALSF